MYYYNIKNYYVIIKIGDKMKKIFLVLFLTFLLVGCSRGSKEFNISLKGNPTTGYTWSYLLSEAGIIEEVSNTYLAAKNDKDIVGVGGVYNFIFKPLKKGEVELTFNYTRSWEEKPIQSVIYKIMVDEKNIITYKVLEEYGLDEDKPVIK